jgi:hypothetical protein
MVSARIINFSWGASNDNSLCCNSGRKVVGYRIYYALDKISPKTEILCDVNSTTTKYKSINELDSNTDYYLIVKTYGYTQESGESNEVIVHEGITSICTPTGPLVLTANFETKELTLKWTNPTTLDKNGKIILENENFKGIMIRYNVGKNATYPKAHSEGTLFAAIDGELDSCNICTREVIDGDVYKFSFFTYDNEYNFSK